MRETAAYVLKCNGAYLIHFVGETAGDRPEDENFDAAASLATAKRIAVAGALNNGYTGAVRWALTVQGGNSWELEMTAED